MVFHHYNVGTAVLCYIMTGLRRVCSVDPNSKSPVKGKKQNRELEDKQSCWQNSDHFREKALRRIFHKTTTKRGGLNSKRKDSLLGHGKHQEWCKGPKYLM